MTAKLILIKNKTIVLALSVLALGITIFLIENNVFHFTNGRLIYPLDDTYIHMSIAKQLATHNTWGINNGSFASASSSLLYTLLLAALFKIFSINTIIPFIINVVAGIVLLFIIQKKFQKENIDYTAQLFFLLLVIFFTPLPVIIISGMEHTLQCVFSLAFIIQFCEWIEKEKQTVNTASWKVPFSLYVFGLLVCAIRYEGMFIVAVACCILLFNKKIVQAILLGFVSLLPLIIFGIYSVMQGSYFLPNSVLLKSSPLETSATGIISYLSNIFIDKLTIEKNGITQLATQRLLILLPLVFIFFHKNLTKKNQYTYFILIVTCCTILQLAFASTGWFYRYEAYLMLCTTVVVCILFYKYRINLFNRFKPIILAALLIVFVLIFPIVLRSTAAYAKACQACINIYEQQNQMADFLKTFYNNDTIAVNDIGAVSYYTNGKIVDLWGLANLDVAKSKKEHYDTPSFLYNLSNNEHVKIAIVYDSWFDSALLNKWQKVATWQIPNNVICGSDIVSFYAVDKNAKAALQSNLVKYKYVLPGDVKVVYYNNANE